MNGFSQAFLDHLAGEVTTVSHCWKLVRRDGLTMGFTDHDTGLDVDGQAYTPQTGFSGSESRESVGLSLDTADIEGVLSSDQITDADVESGLYDGATVATLLVNWRDPGQFAMLRSAVVGKIERRDGVFAAELESLTHELDRRHGRTVRRTCDADLGDARCRVDLDQPGFTGAGTVTGLAAADRLAVTGLGDFPPGWFSNGILTWTTGAKAGHTARVVAHAAGEPAVLVFWQALEGIGTDDDFIIVTGCDKAFGTCRDKFGNMLNFQGFPHLPGNDAAYGYVSGGQVFDGGTLTP